MSIRLKNKDELLDFVLTEEDFKGKDFSWSSYFGNDNPIVLDAGCGKGEFLLDHAKREKDINFIGIDYSVKKALFTAKKITFNELSNAAIIKGSFEEIFPIAFKNGMFDRVHMNFPDPWPKKRHHKRRSLNKELVQMYVDLLKSNGDFYFVSDNFDYAEVAFPIIDAHPSLQNQIKESWYVNEIEGYFVTLFHGKAQENGDNANYLWFKKN